MLADRPQGGRPARRERDVTAGPSSRAVPSRNAHAGSRSSRSTATASVAGACLQLAVVTRTSAHGRTRPRRNDRTRGRSTCSNPMRGRAGDRRRLATGKPEPCGSVGVDRNFAVIACGRRTRRQRTLPQLLRSHRSVRTKPATGRGERAAVAEAVQLLQGRPVQLVPRGYETARAPPLLLRRQLHATAQRGLQSVAPPPIAATLRELGFRLAVAGPIVWRERHWVNRRPLLPSCFAEGASYRGASGRCPVSKDAVTARGSGPLLGCGVSGDQRSSVSSELGRALL
jgi:hypothetical protein